MWRKNIKIKLVDLVESDNKIYVKKDQPVPKGKTLKTGPRGGQYFIGSTAEKQSYEKSTPKKKTNDKKISSAVENAFKNLGIENDELEGWSKSGDNNYFVKGEFDKGINVFKRDKSWYISTEDSEGFADQIKRLPNNEEKIKDVIDDYKFDISHPDDDE